MSKDYISLRQLLALLFAALLSPMIQVLPRTAVEIGGKAGWLSALFALPVVLLLCWAYQATPGRLGGGAGMAEGLELAFGRWPARVLVLLYLIWGGLLLGWNARWCAYRALSINYRNAPMPLFILGLLALTLWLGHKSLSAFCRAGEIFALALGVALAVALALAALRTEWNNVGPIWLEDLPGAAGGAVPVLGLVGYGVLGAFLAGQVKRREVDRGRLLRWGALWCALLAVFQLITIGCFGPGLIQKMETPFFILLRGVGVPGAFERVESLIMSLWLLADLAFLGLILFACRAMVRYLTRGEERPWVPVLLVAAAGALALFTLENLFSLSWVMERLIPAGNLILGIGVPLLTGIVIAWKKRREKV